ncbi:MAG: MOSC domain-containing protein [Xanthomonadales bacterium]
MRCEARNRCAWWPWPRGSCGRRANPRISAPTRIPCSPTRRRSSSPTKRRWRRFEDGRDPVPMNRFRPNIVLDGPTAFAEHAAGTVAGAGYALRLAHPCQRCVVTTIDQATARRDPEREPYRTLVRLNPMPGRPDAPAFGQNAALASGPDATIRVGDRVTLTGTTK